MKIDDILNKDSNTILLEMPYADIVEIEHILTLMLKKHLGLRYDSSGHFLGRLVPKDEIPEKRISKELKGKNLYRDGNITKEDFYKTFGKLINRYGKSIMGQKQFGKEFKATVIDQENNLNIGFKINYQHRDKYPLFRILTVHKKKGFVPKETDATYRV